MEERQLWLPVSELPALLSAWQERLDVLAPSRENGVVNFSGWKGDINFLDWYRNTTVPVKSLLMPNAEPLFSYSKSAIGFQLTASEISARQQVIVGVRPCDLKAITLLDNVMGGDSADPLYRQRRENTFIVGLACDRPYTSCFCTSLGGNPDSAAGADLMLTRAQDGYIVRTITAKGQQLLEGSSLSIATQNQLSQAQFGVNAASEKMERHLDATEVSQLLKSNFENKAFWQEVAAQCAGCGVCTLLCPTCYCFDINDDNGVRWRSADSCAFSTYTKMPMENPRAERWQRVRNRICHKYQFYPALWGEPACTGCGRCIRLCPSGLDITAILNSLPAAASGGVSA